MKWGYILKKQKIKLRQIRLISLISIPLTIALSAQEANTYQTEAITSTDKVKNSYQVSKQTAITSKDVYDRQVVNVKELLQTDSSISVGGGGNGAQKIYVRGMEDRMLRVTIDGAAQNGNAFHHQGNVQIDPRMLKQVVVSKGAANASVGPGALAGTVVFETKDASDFLRGDQNVGGEVNAGFNTNFGYRFGGSVYKRVYKDFGLLAYFNQSSIINYREANHTYSSFLNYEPKNIVLGSNSYTNNILLKASGQIDENQRLSVSYSVVNDQSTRPFRSNITDPKALNPKADNDNASEIFRHNITDNIFNTSYEYIPSDRSAPKVKINAYNSIKNVLLTPADTFSKEEQKEDSEGTAKRAIVLQNYGVDLKLRNDINDNTHIIEYGLNYQGVQARDDAIGADERNATIITPISNGQKTSVTNRGIEDGQIYGGYAQDTWNLNEQISWGFGSRYDIYYYLDKNTHNIITQGFSPSTSLTYTPRDGLDVGIKYAYTTRGALPGDITLLRDTEIFVNPNLRSEKGQNAELDIDYVSDHFALSGSIFWNRIDDYINSYGISGSGNTSDKGCIRNNSTDDNGGECSGVRQNLAYPLITYGFEADATYMLNGFEASLGASRSWLTAGGRGGGRLLADTYELGATWGYAFTLQLKYGTDKFDLSWLTRYVTGFSKGTEGWNIYHDVAEDISKPGYTVSNLYFSYYPMGRDKLSIDFSILNVFNALYTDPTSPLKTEADGKKTEDINQVRSALYEPGTDYRINVRYRF